MFIIRRRFIGRGRLGLRRGGLAIRCIINGICLMCSLRFSRLLSCGLHRIISKGSVRDRIGQGCRMFLLSSIHFIASKLTL